MDRARTQYVKAQRAFDQALSVALDTSFSSDGAKGLRIASKNYAEALKEYNEAVHKMAAFLG